MAGTTTLAILHGIAARGMQTHDVRGSLQLTSARRRQNRRRRDFFCGECPSSAAMAPIAVATDEARGVCAVDTGSPATCESGPCAALRRDLATLGVRP